MNSSIREELLELLSELADSEIAPQRAERLEEILADDPEARLLYMQHIDLQVELSCMASENDQEEEVETVAVSFARPQPPPRRWWPLAAAAVIVFGLIFVLRSGGDDEVIARLDHIKGDVMIIPSKGLPWSPDNTLDIRSSYTVQLRGDASSAVLVYPDGTLVALVGDTELGFEGNKAKNLILPNGVIAASVTEQPSGQPLTVTTETAEIEVVGTEFTLETDAANTHLAVLEGAVDFIRTTDTSRVQVAEGEVSTVGLPPEPGVPEPKLVAGPQAPPPTEWSRDFETGLPAGWKRGQFVSAGLPRGSRGGVAEERTYDGSRKYYQIEAPSSFVYGLHQINADTHLHVTYRMAYPDWVNIFIGARSPELRGATWHTYKNVAINADSTEPGVWQTITIPLAEFAPAKGYGEPILGKVPYGILFSSTPNPRGLVVDSMWVTQGGPGRVVVEKIR